MKGVEKATVVVADIGVANNITGNTKANAQMNRATKNLNDNTIGSDAASIEASPRNDCYGRVDPEASNNDMNKSNQIKSKVMNKLKAGDRRISQSSNN